MLKNAGNRIATLSSSSRVDSGVTWALLKVCCGRRVPPTRTATPRNSSVVPMIDPVICACTTWVWARDSTNSANTSSAALPKVTLSRLPMALPACSATCSVARRIQSASTPIATSPARNTQGDASASK